MLQSELYISEEIMHKRLHERRQGLEIRNLRKQAAALRPGWLPRQACRLLCGLGSLLVAIGERLKRYDVARPLPLEEVGRSR